MSSPSDITRRRHEYKIQPVMSDFDPAESQPIYRLVCVPPSYNLGLEAYASVYFESAASLVAIWSMFRELAYNYLSDSAQIHVHLPDFFHRFISKHRDRAIDELHGLISGRTVLIGAVCMGPILNSIQCDHASEAMLTSPFHKTPFKLVFYTKTLTSEFSLTCNIRETAKGNNCRLSLALIMGFGGGGGVTWSDVTGWVVSVKSSSTPVLGPFIPKQAAVFVYEREAGSWAIFTDLTRGGIVQLPIYNMSGNRAAKSGIAADVQRKVSDNLYILRIPP